MPLIRLYDLAADDPDRRFSPACWKTRMALAHKGLDVETIPVRFTDKQTIAPSGQKLVPVIETGGLWLSDSWKIAEYLEENFPDRPSVFGGRAAKAASRFINCWVDIELTPKLFPLIVKDIFDHLAPQDKSYFRESRESRIGMSLEDYSADRDNRISQFRASLQPLRVLLRTQPFLGGDCPLYADYAVFGPFQWARTISTYHILADDDPIRGWRDRMLDLFDGLARRVPAYRT